MENATLNANDPTQQMGNPHENMNQKVGKSTQVLYQGIKKAYPQLKPKQVEDAALQIMKNNNNGRVTVDGVDIDVSDFTMMVARSIQTISSETSPVEEFYRWIDDAKDVIAEMTDNEITESDMKHREDFLNDLNQREVEIKMCLSLYQHAAMFGSGKVKEQAQKQLEFLRIKWAKLLELRSAVQNSTKDRMQASLEPKVDEEEHNRGKLYVMALCYMQKGLEIPPRIKLKLGMISGIAFGSSLADELIEKRAPQQETKSDVLERIKQLSGRQSSLDLKQPNSIPERQSFNAEQFRTLAHLSREYM